MNERGMGLGIMFMVMVRIWLVFRIRVRDKVYGFERVSGFVFG